MTPPLVCGDSCVLFVCTLSMTGKSTLYKRRGHFILSIRIIANLAFDPSLPAMVYIEKRTVRTTLKVGGTFFQVHIAIHHKSAIKNFVGCHGSLAALVKKLQDNAILSFNDIFNI